MSTDNIAHIRPVIALSESRGRLVTLARVKMGVPIEPNATGAVFASRQIPAA
jgi:hypothetical protein